MNQRGRKSANSSGATGVLAPVTSHKRLLPSAHLSAAEQAIWLDLINDQPAASFSITHGPLIEMYAKHVVHSRTLCEEIANFDRAWLADDDGMKRYDKLLGMHERETRAASSLATRLRITRQAVDQQTIARAQINEPKSRKPWELSQIED